MRRFLIDWMRNGLAKRGRFVTQLTSADDIREFICSVRPVGTSHDLIRLGPDYDGGYLVPDDLAGIGACFSPGVDKECRFEIDCGNRGMRVFMADRSVPGPPQPHPAFSFLPKFIGGTTDGDFLTMDDWFAASGAPTDVDMILQMDIEGHEYEVLLAASPSLLHRFRIIVIEFHSLDQLRNKPFFGIVAATFRKLLQSHACVHIHPNNYCGSDSLAGIEIPRAMEFTFLRRDRLKPGRHPGFPHPLDRDNTAKPSLPLPSLWQLDG